LSKSPQKLQKAISTASNRPRQHLNKSEGHSPSISGVAFSFANRAE
jgi:hypothetical protein